MQLFVLQKVKMQWNVLEYNNITSIVCLMNCKYQQLDKHRNLCTKINSFAEVYKIYMASLLNFKFLILKFLHFLFDIFFLLLVKLLKNDTMLFCFCQICYLVLKKHEVIFQSHELHKMSIVAIMKYRSMLKLVKCSVNFHYRRVIFHKITQSIYKS